MGSRGRSSAVRGWAREAFARLGREEQAREVLGRLREARALFDGVARRELRDEHALRVVLAATLRVNGNAIDVGANEGGVLAAILAVAPDGDHIAYEPIPWLQDRLRDAFPEVDVRGRALSDAAGTAEFVHVIDVPTMSGLRRRADLPADARTETISVIVERLDDALEDGYVPALIKIDVEGAEVNVVRGAAATLERHRPFVVFEHGTGGADLYGSSSGELFDILEGAGMRIFDLEGAGPFTRTQFEEMFAEPVWNWLAAPG
jgi:FkbM family methyltransferase